MWMVITGLIHSTLMHQTGAVSVSGSMNVLTRHKKKHFRVDNSKSVNHGKIQYRLAPRDLKALLEVYSRFHSLSKCDLRERALPQVLSGFRLVFTLIFPNFGCLSETKGHDEDHSRFLYRGS